MAMRVDQTGNDCLSGHVDACRTGGNGNGIGGTNRHDATIGDHQCRRRQRRRASTINDPCAGECESRAHWGRRGGRSSAKPGQGENTYGNRPPSLGSRHRPLPVRGDMNYEGEYSGWKDYSGVKVPSLLHHHQDWDDETQPPNYNGGHNRLNILITDARPNDCGAPLTVPAAVRTATVPPERVDAQRLADGVYYLTGGTHHSVAVEFRDYVVLVDAPLNEKRSIALIEAIYRIFPGKPIRYVVNSHHHFDHLGGIRALFHEGAAIITHHTNRDFYKQEVLSHDPWTLEPDRLSLYPPTEFSEGYQFETVEIRHTISDGTRNLDIYYVQGTPHAEGMLMAYLPRERLLIEADLFTPPAPGTAAPAIPPQASVNLYDNIKAYRLDVANIAPLHGRLVPWAELLRYVEKNRSSDHPPAISDQMRSTSA